MEPAVIRDETARDLDAIREVHLLAFPDDAPARFADDLRRSGEAMISLVAERDMTIVGHVLFSRIQAPMRALILSPLGVHPDFQRAGIGSALVRKGLERAQQEDWEAVFLVGSPAYYGRFGFSSAAAQGYASPYYGPPFMARLFGESVPRSGQLVFPATFAEDIKQYPALLDSLRGLNAQ